MTDSRADSIPLPSEVRALIARFNEHRETYEQQTYNETQARREFIDPFFAALGWDVDNRAGLAEAYKDVIHEDAIKIGGATKAPDYCFRIGGTRKFFVEAKKPSIGVSNDPGPAYQVRRYAWTSKLPLSIVTDFQEFAVYDCRIPPKPGDKATVARIFYCTFDEYTDKWSEIAGIFSKDAVLKGSFDKYAESKKRKKGTAEVDAEFLKEIEEWRELLAKNFALRNDDLSVRDLNFAVERTIDRIIFLRMCEDRGIEPYGKLQALLNGSAIYDRLAALFREADDKYNAGLFYFRQEADRGPPDELTLALTLDDKILKQIIARLYYPESPYEFSVLPTEILGQVYEQFLGKVIRLTAGHRAVIEEKPEVRKAGGVYYTPTYIVDYIVKNTVGKLLEGKTPADVGPERETKTGKTKKLAKGAKMLRVLDPACGSGSFLLGAYQFLLDWHRDFYVNAVNEPHAPASGPGDNSLVRESLLAPTTDGNPLPLPNPFKDRLYQGPGGHWRLTIREKKRILLNNIYGVDIDPQAVEVTKLSLLLKVLEGETAETIGSTLRLFQERALPDLSNNIKCGNSLIGPDFYENRQMDMFDEEERRRINVFDWHAEFPDVFSTSGRSEISNIKSASPDSGFDAVIGNPPYRRELDFKELMDEIAGTAFGKKYKSPRMDLWYYFVHRAMELVKPSGLLTYIVNAYWTAGTGAEKLIAALRENASIVEFFSLAKLRVFARVSGQHMIFRAINDNSGQTTTIKIVPSNLSGDAKPYVTGEIQVAQFCKTKAQLFRDTTIDLQPPGADFSEKFSKYPVLESFGLVRQGIAENPPAINKKTKERFNGPWQVGEGVFALRPDEVNRLSIPQSERELLKPYHDLCDLGRYYIANRPSLFLIYSTKVTCPDIESFPTIQSHLQRFRVVMDQRRETQKGSNQWWHLHWPRDATLWQSPKIVSVQMATRPSFVTASEPVYVSFSTNVFVKNAETGENLNYFCGILNSRLMWDWYQHHAKRRGAGLEINGSVLAATPIRPINFLNKAETALHDRIVSLVDQMLSLHKSLAAAKTDHDKTTLQRQIDATDKQIDQLVYQLYALTPDEIRIVEEATR